MSFSTPFGDVKLLFDDEEVSFNYRCIDPNPDVNGVYKISFDYNKTDNKEHTLHLLLNDSPVKGDIESGECFEALLFYIDKSKITLGTYASFGDLLEYDLDYDGDYSSNGIKISVLPTTASQRFEFGVCWLNRCTDVNDRQTWYGADPMCL